MVRLLTGCQAEVLPLASRPRVVEMASSSRSQRAMRTARAAAYLTWEAPSVGVRWRPLLSVVIVTHLVTRSLTSGDVIPDRTTTWMQATGTYDGVKGTSASRTDPQIWDWKTRALPCPSRSQQV